MRVEANRELEPRRDLRDRVLQRKVAAVEIDAASCELRAERDGVRRRGLPVVLR